MPGLDRFVEAQGLVYEQVLRELRAGRKTSHWMWFVFPQLRGLGQSPTARHFGIDGREEAGAYLGHALLGARLIECSGLVLRTEAVSAHAMFGSPDDMKLRSCMTLFGQISENAVFSGVLERFYGGTGDTRTLEMLGAQSAEL